MIDRRPALENAEVSVICPSSLSTFCGGRGEVNILDPKIKLQIEKKPPPPSKYDVLIA